MMVSVQKTLYRHPTRLLVMTLAALSLFSCKENYPVYDQSDDFISFDPNDNKKVYSFVFKGEDIVKDTVWFTVKLIGKLVDHDRQFAIRQFFPEEEEKKEEPLPSTPPEEIKPEEEVIEAIAGVHYVSFDDPEYKKLLVLPANERETRFPIIILRDKSLSTVKGTRLRIRIAESENLQPGYISNLIATLSISDRLVRPTQWGFLLQYYLGAYGPVKHQFMIKTTGLHWDDEFITENYFNEPAKADQAYLGALQAKLANALMKENALRKERGEGPLTETNGDRVRFRQDD